MAQLDGSFYLQSQGPDIGQSFERGMRLGDMMRQRKIQDMELQKKQQIDDAMKSGVVTNPDGTQSFNSEMALGNLMKVDPLVAQEKKAQFQQQEIADEHFKADMTFNESMKALNNPAYYSTAVNKLISKGIISADQVPKEFDLAFVKNAAGRAGTAKDYLEGLLKEQHYKNEEENRKLDRNIQMGKLNQSKYEFEKEMELKRLAEAAKYGPKTVEKRLADLNSGDKARLDNIKLGYPAAGAMDKALNDGDNTFSLVGDNKFTVALDQMAEAFGRMQSGGAINKDEEARFKKMSPTSTDSKEIQAQKLANMQKVFLDRLDTLGFKPEEVGIQKQELSYGKKSDSTPKEGDTKEYQGVTYRVVNGHWVQQ